MTKDQILDMARKLKDFSNRTKACDSKFSETLWQASEKLFLAARLYSWRE